MSGIWGLVNVNVLIGSGVLPTDRDLFFGPIHENDHWHVEENERINLASLLAKLGVFESAKEAGRHGFNRPIDEGFTDLLNVRKKHRVSILKITGDAE